MSHLSGWKKLRNSLSVGALIDLGMILFLDMVRFSQQQHAVGIKWQIVQTFFMTNSVSYRPTRSVVETP